MRTTAIRMMTLADVPLVWRLKQQAGWNQTEADLRRFLALEPRGCFVAERQGHGVGVVTTCTFEGSNDGRHNAVGWIAMMLVDQAFRRQGIGQALMTCALEYLDERSMRSVRLDATPEGRPLYEKLGFISEYSLHRYGGQPAIDAVMEAREFRSADLPGVLEIDRAITGTDRSKLLVPLLAEPGSHSYVMERAEHIAGYLTMRPGSNAPFVGPCVALDAAAGAALLTVAFTRLHGQSILIDVPDDNLAAVALLEAAGLAPRRQLVRMCRGPSSGEQPAKTWATSGPEKG